MISLRLMRLGAKKRPFYRIVAIDSRKPRESKAKDIIKQVSLELDWVKPEPEPKVVVKSFGDSAVNLEARVWISRPRKRIDTISHITDRVKEVFNQEGIEIPFPKRDIYIKKSE